MKGIKRRLEALESKNSCPKVFFNIENELDEEIEWYKMEHPDEDVVVFNIKRADKAYNN